MSKTQISQNKFTKVQIAITLSILMHFFIYLVTYYFPKPEINKDIVIEINDDDSVYNLEYQKDLEEQKKLVEFDKSSDQQKENNQAKYLAAKNNQVKKETIAKLDTQFKNVEKSTKENSQKTASEENQWASAKNEKNDSKLFNTGFDVYQKMKQQENAKEQKRQLANQQQDSSTSTDRLENTEQSLMTQLNTKEYKYYGYYTRIRQQLNQWWQPKVKEKVTKLMASGRTIASTDNKNTKVIIFLNNSGHLVKVQVLGASGVRELDDAAVEAFRQAAPFPNPPRGLADADGTIKIRWDFIVES